MEQDDKSWLDHLAEEEQAAGIDVFVSEVCDVEDELIRLDESDWLAAQ